MPQKEARKGQTDSPSATNVRHASKEIQRILERIQTWMKQEAARSFEIGDAVERLVAKHQTTVKDIAKQVGGSRTRLGELRRTALAARGESRFPAVDK